MSDFDPDWPHGHTTRDGKAARIVSRDAKGPYPIVALIATDDGREEPHSYTCEGDFTNDRHPIDLINAPAPKRVVYVNVYPDDSGGDILHLSREKADKDAASYRIGCNRIELEPGRWDE